MDKQIYGTGLCGIALGFAMSFGVSEEIAAGLVIVFGVIGLFVCLKPDKLKEEKDVK